MLDVLVALCQESNSSVQSASVASGGNLYTEGDIIQVSGGGAHPQGMRGATATFEVTSVSSGAVTGIRIRNYGCYSTTPTPATGTTYNTTNLFVSDNSATGCQVTLVFGDNGWEVLRQTSRVASVTVSQDYGGSNYQASDTVSLLNSAGGQTTAATVKVTSVGPNGAITGVQISTRGVYDYPEETLLASGGSGNGARFSVTYTALVGDKTAHREAIVRPVLAGDSAIVIRSYETAYTNVPNEVATGLSMFLIRQYSDTRETSNQTGLHFGSDYPPSATNTEHLVWNMAPDDNDPYDFFIHITPRYISAVVSLEKEPANNNTPIRFNFAAQFGLGNPFGHASDYGVPLFAFGSGCDAGVGFRDTGALWPGSLQLLGGTNRGSATTGGVPGVFFGPGFSAEVAQNYYAASGLASGVVAVQDPAVSAILPGWEFNEELDANSLDSFSRDGLTESHKFDQSSLVGSTASSPSPGTTLGLPVAIQYGIPDTAALGSVQYRHKLREYLVVGPGSGGSADEGGRELYFEIPGVRWIDKNLSPAITLSNFDELEDENGVRWIVFWINAIGFFSSYRSPFFAMRSD